MTRYPILIALVLMALLASLAACAGAPTPDGSAPSAADDAPSAGGKLKVVATTTIVGDVVRQVGGDAIDLKVLLPAGADPHGFQPTPQDATLIANADLVFANGLNLEEFLEKLIENAGGSARVGSMSKARLMPRVKSTLKARSTRTRAPILTSGWTPTACASGRATSRRP